jgi:dynein heavy chain
MTDSLKHVNTLGEIGKTLNDYINELEQINMEEKLFNLEISQMPMLQEIFAKKDPFDKLWNTFYNFQVKEALWMKGNENFTENKTNPRNFKFRIGIYFLGTFIGLNAEDISDEVQNMWRNMHKLQKQFADCINPRKVADYTKHKIERFKNYVPVLQVICNPGLKDRHWKQV